MEWAGLPELLLGFPGVTQMNGHVCVRGERERGRQAWRENEREGERGREREKERERG